MKSETRAGRGSELVAVVENVRDICYRFIANRLDIPSAHDALVDGSLFFGHVATPRNVASSPLTRSRSGGPETPFNVSSVSNVLSDDCMNQPDNTPVQSSCHAYAELYPPISRAGIANYYRHVSPSDRAGNAFGAEWNSRVCGALTERMLAGGEIVRLPDGRMVNRYLHSLSRRRGANDHAEPRNYSFALPAECQKMYNRQANGASMTLILSNAINGKSRASSFLL